MRTATDALRSMRRFAWLALGDQWEVRYWGTEGGSFPRLPDGSPGPFARVSAITPIAPVRGQGGASMNDVMRTFQIAAYPSLGLSDPEQAIFAAEAVEETLFTAFEVGLTWQDPLLAPDAPAAAIGPSLGLLPAGSYDYAVATLGGGGESAVSPVRVVTTTAAASLVYVGWNDVQGATGYRVYRGVHDGTLGLIGEVPTAIFTDDGSQAPSTPPPSILLTATVEVRSAKDRVPLYDYDGVPTDGPDSVSYRRGKNDYLRVLDCPINRVVDPEDDTAWLVTAEPRVTWRRMGSVPTGTQIVQDVRLREVAS